MLQVFIDDSGAKGMGAALFLGGVMGKAEVFAPIADEWDRELRATDPGRIAYFKADEACHLDGEFIHWRKTARDQKVRRMAKHLNRPELMVVFSAVNLGGHTQMERILGSKITDAKHHFFNQPLFMVFHALMIAVSQEAIRQKVTERIEIVIDNNDVFRDELRRQYDVLLEVLKPEQRAVMPAQLLFRDDKEFVLLQAADLLMGDLRLRGKKHREWTQNIGLEKLKVSRHSKPLDEGRLMEMTEGTLNKQLNRPDIRISLKRVKKEG